MIDVLKVLQQKRNELQQQLDTINSAIKVLGGQASKSKGTGKAKRVVSAAAKRKMSLAAKKRWAERKKKASA